MPLDACSTRLDEATAVKQPKGILQLRFEMGLGEQVYCKLELTDALDE